MLKCGFAKKCITPPLDTPIVGYYAERRVKGVLDDLYVRATAFDDGEARAVVLAVDVCLISKGMCNLLRARIAKVCSLDENAVFINANHTHTGPLLEKDFASDLECPKEYEEFFKNTLCETAKEAFEDLSPARLFYAEKEVPGISFIRRFRMKDGSVATNPGIQNPDIDHPIGTPDEMMRMLKIVREEKDNLVLVCFGTHTDTVGGERVSADYPAYLCEALEGAMPDVKCMFLMGPQGDVNHFNVDGSNGGWKLTNDNFGDKEFDPTAHARHMGRTLAGAAMSVYAVAKEVPVDEITFGAVEVALPSHQENDKLEEAEKIVALYEAGRHVELPYKGMALTTVVAGAKRIVNLKNGPAYFFEKVFAIKVGDFVFAGLPGEPFVEIGRRIYEGAPYRHMFVTCLTNAGESYYPTTSAIMEGGYEASSCEIGAGADNILVEGMLTLLDSMNND